MAAARTVARSAAARRRILGLVAAVVTLAAVVGCASSARRERPPGAYAVSSSEAAAGWRVLFDGTSFAGWRGYRMTEVPAGWEVRDGMIHFVKPESGQRGDLTTVERFADFELELEWAIGPGGNSGIFFRVSEDLPRSYESGPEMQVLDDEGHRDGRSPLTSAGSNYALHPPSEAVLRPVGEFNQVRLLVDRDHVEHWLNGVKVVEYRLWDDDWKERVAASKFAVMPHYGRNRAGQIVLQDHGDEVWFRRIKIRQVVEYRLNAEGQPVPEAHEQ